MHEGPANDTTLMMILAEPEVCEECHSVSRLTNGLCLKCLLSGALDEPKTPTGKEAFKEVLAGVKARDGDWHIADHEILAEIARGGMGVVYRAKEPNSGRIVALKCVLAYQGDSDHVVARFRREAETAARLDHPNIVPIYQVGETADGFPFYTMKYAPAGSLSQARGPLRQHPRKSVQLMVKVARAVQFAHEKGVLHRDLKPGNILLDGHGEPLVSDFGLARCEAASSYLTRSLASFGTPGYIAPEQADGPAASLTPAADIYSLGAILFELLTGRPPFVGDNAFAVMKQSSAQPAPKVRTLARNVDRDLETICARCLEREPADRYQSAASLANDLQNWIDDRPIAARPPSVWLQSRRWVRQNRAVAVLLAAFSLLGAGSFLWQFQAMKESVLAARSITLLPFYDLDTATVDRTTTHKFKASLQTGLTALGPARVTVLEPAVAFSRDRIGDISKEPRQNRGRAIITGTARMAQGRQRISFQLIDPASKEDLFTYRWEDEAKSDAGAVITPQAIRAISSVLTASDWSDLIRKKSDPGLRNASASDAITAGRLIDHKTPEDFDKGINLFQKAVEIEPNSSLAHAYLAMEATNRVHYNPDRRFLELGKKEAEKALQLSPESPEAHRALAGVYYQEGKFAEALEQALQTMEMSALGDRIALFVGMTLDILGRPHHALAWHRVASQLATQPGEADASIGDCWTRLGVDDQAERAYKRAVEFRPGSPSAIVPLAHLRMFQGDFDAAREICRSVRDTRGQLAEIAAQIEFFDRKFDVAMELYRDLHRVNPFGGGSFYGAMTYCSAAGRAKQALGELSEAKRILEDCLVRERANAEREPANPEAVYRLSAVEACLGMTEASLSHLRKAVALGWVDYRSLNLDPRFDNLRGSEFQTIIDDLSGKVAEMREQALTKLAGPLN